MSNGNFHNDEFSFLYKKCKLIKPVTISAMSKVSIFMDAIRSADTNGFVWCDETLYDVLRKKYLSYLKTKKPFESATNVMNRVSKAVTGDSKTWRIDDNK